MVEKRGANTIERQGVIATDPGILGGTPVFAGTRVPVASLIAHLKAGDTLHDFLEGFPSVTRDQAEAFLEIALQATSRVDPRGRMRVLLDENMDRRLKQQFEPDFEVVTVTERGWSGKENGELLRAAEMEFDALVTMDRGMEHQQNASELELGIVIVSAPSNRRQDVEPAMPGVNSALRTLQPGQVVRVTA